MSIYNVNINMYICTLKCLKELKIYPSVKKVNCVIQNLLTITPLQKIPYLERFRKTQPEIFTKWS